MNEVKNIQRLLDNAINGNTEYDKLELKDARGGIPSDLWKPISAFSNTKGGTIVFGVKENVNPRSLVVVGNIDMATLQERIVYLMEQKLSNHGTYQLKIFKYREFMLLALVVDEVPKGQKPCYQIDLGLPRGSCIRVGNVNQQITDEELRAFLRYSPEYKHDRTKAKGVDYNMLSSKKINIYLEQSAKRTDRSFTKNENIDKILKNVGIVDIFGGVLSPTIGGFLVFSQDEPQEVTAFSRFSVRCVKYSGPSTYSSIINQLEINGTIDNQIEQTYRFIIGNIATKAEIFEAKRVDTPEYPPEAIREIVANALIHRDYLITGTYVNISIFSDRIEISNPGNLPPGITIDNIKDSQFSRNEVIAKVMRDLNFMEEFGRGIDLVYARMREWGLPEPLFKNRSNMFKVTLLGNRYSVLNDRQVEIWHYLQDNMKITASIAHGLFNNISRPTINNDLKEMSKLGLLEVKGASSNTYYEAKY